MVFVPFTAPGDTVRVRLLEESKRYAQGELIEVIERSPIRIKSPCPVFGRCGGCQWHHIPYEVQWETKAGGVFHALERVQVDDSRGAGSFAGRKNLELSQPDPAPRNWG